MPSVSAIHSFVLFFCCDPRVYVGLLPPGRAGCWLSFLPRLVLKSIELCPDASKWRSTQKHEETFQILNKDQHMIMHKEKLVNVNLDISCSNKTNHVGLQTKERFSS